MKVKKIYACRYTADADMIISLLKDNKFNPLELQMSPHVGTAGADIFFYVQISDEEYESAKKFLINNGFKDVI